MKRVLRAIDFISEIAGTIAAVAAIALILVLGVKVFARYLLGEPTIWSYESASMLGVAVAYIGFAYTLRYKGHVRVDVFYMRLSQRRQALVDVVAYVLFFFPLISLLAYYSVNKMLFSLRLSERLLETNWYPPAWTIRAVVLVGFSLLALQGIAEFIRHLNVLIRDKSYD